MVELMTLHDQVDVTSSELDHAMKGCEVVGLRMPFQAFIDLAVLFSDECVEREAAADSLNIMKPDATEFTKNRYADLCKEEKDKVQDHVLHGVLTKLCWKPEQAEAMMLSWLDKGIATTEVNQSLRDELSIIRRCLKASTLEQKNAARQELRDKANMKMVRQFTTLPYGVTFIQNLDKALMEHEQNANLNDRLEKILQRIDSTGMREQLRTNNSHVQITTMCVRLRGEVSQVLCLAGGKEDVD